MARKIIQISTATSVASLTGTTQEYYHYITALCDDGTLWRMVNKGRWVKYPPIPQDETPKATNDE